MHLYKKSIWVMYSAFVATPHHTGVQIRLKII